MSDLQLSLLAASGVLVIGVFAYNKWQEWRHRKVAQAVFQDEQPDVLMGKEDTSNTMTDMAEPSDGETQGTSQIAASEERREPSLAPMAEAAELERIEPSLSFSQETTFENTVPDSTELVSNVADFAAPELSQLPATTLAPVEPVLQTVAEKPVLRAVPLEVTVNASGLTALPRDLANPDSDLTITLELISPLRAADILHAEASALAKLSKPVFWLGLNADEQWQAITATTGGAFRHLRLVVQLANRQGPMSEQEIYHVQNTAQEIAVQWNAVLDVSDAETALQRAGQIDQFCVDVDLQIGINLVGPIPFPGTKIRALAEAAGMSVNTQGVFEKQDDNGRTLFTLSNLEATPFAAETLRTLKTHGLTFLLDVPRVADTGFVFDHMLRLAKQFSEALQAKIVDDNRRPLTEAQLASIREQFVQKPQADMLAKRIPAGSPVALRLFS